MSRVTSKRQVTIPKVIAEQYGIRRGSELQFLPAGDSIRVHVIDEPKPADPEALALRLRLFDATTQRQRARDARVLEAVGPPTTERGWRREDLYDRGLSR